MTCYLCAREVLGLDEGESFVAGRYVCAGCLTQALEDSANDVAKLVTLLATATTLLREAGVEIMRLRAPSTLETRRDILAQSMEVVSKINAMVDVVNAKMDEYRPEENSSGRLDMDSSGH